MNQSTMKYSEDVERAPVSLLEIDTEPLIFTRTSDLSKAHFSS